MGSIRFERIPAVSGSTKNVLEFDSSYDRAIARAYGFEEGSVELTETSRTDSLIIFDVFARGVRASSDAEPKPLVKVGRLQQLTRDEIHRRNSGGIHYGRKWQ